MIRNCENQFGQILHITPILVHGRYTRPGRVVAIDPGRVNLIMAYDTSNGKYHRLTRNYYYRACGMKRLVKKSNERNLKRKGNESVSD
jgi:hypothetical protein